MNRIYQGRVTKVEKLKNGKSPDDREELKDWQTALWRHHELFQDAVSYYTLALAAMAEGLPDKHPINVLRKRMEEAWEEFPRKTVTPAKNLRDSVRPWLGLSESASFGDALKKILPPAPENKEVRALAVALLAEKARTLKPQKTSASYWGRFCDDLKKKPNWDYSEEELARKTGSGDWVAGLWSEDALNKIDELAKSLKLSSLVKCVPDGQINPEGARNLVKEALDHLEGVSNGTKKEKNDPGPAKKTNNWLRQHASDVRNFIHKNKNQFSSLPNGRLITERARGGGININKTYAGVLFKAFPCPFTFDYVRAAVPEPKVKKVDQEKKSEQSATWTELEKRILRIGDDPIELARKNNKPIFKAFTALEKWSDQNSKSCWSDFDKCAFEEALKTLNQFNQKTEEREKRRSEAEAELKYMMDENPEWKPKKETEGDDVREVPILKGDPRYEKLVKLFGDLDEEGSEHATGKIYGPSRASLRGFGKLRNEWVDLFTKANDNPREQDLQKAVTGFQREHKLDMGYTAFFLKLCERDYWDIWRDDTEVEVKKIREKRWVKSVVYAAADTRELAEELERLQEPVRYTPAEPQFSRRLFMFSDIKGKQGAKHIREGLVEVSLAVKDQSGKYGTCRVRLHYSAPRLIRDHLSDGSSSMWLQPMMAALGLSSDARGCFTRDSKGNVKEPAVALMSDFVGRKRELRMLLNFPVDLDISKLEENIGKKARWEKQMNTAYEKNKLKQRFHLIWPGMELKETQEPGQFWWDNPTIQKEGMYCLAIDLSQRRAADYALLHAGVNRDSKTFVELGQAGGQSWFTKLCAAGSLRLPGEDTEVIREGKRQIELSGKKGRNATQSEYDQAIALAKQLLHNENSAELESAARDWLGDNAKRFSFPEQNDKLIDLYYGALSRYKTWLRWSWRLTEQHKELWDKTLDEIRKVPYFASWGELAGNGTNEATVQQLQKLIADAAVDLRNFLEKALLHIAYRALPLRENTWRWIENGKDGKGKPLHLLVSDGQSPAEIPWLRGQRGLSIARIEQLENFRRAVLSLNRLLRHEIGTKPEFGSSTCGESLPDPCPDLTDKIVRLKEERVNQTAHLIIAQSLGVRLKGHSLFTEEREKADMHGEHEVIPGRSPVDFVVLEDLSRYTTDKSRSRSENSRLMKWCHRKINEKVKLLAEPFGIPVIEVFASYSSKFDARTGAPGFRAVEVTSEDRPFWRKTIEKQSVAREVFDCLDNLVGKGLNGIHLVLPQNGGPLFIAAVKEDQPLPAIRQADINAAVNIGLRAIAGPSCYHAHPKVRLIKGESGTDKGKWLPRKGKEANKRENAQFGNVDLDLEVKFNRLDIDSDVLKGDNTNLFHDPLNIACYGFATIQNLQHPFLAHASAVFSRQKGAVARLQWEVCRAINSRRLEAWQKKAEKAAVKR
ncbi:MAG: hypothetical protein A3D87_01715 [Omnitrophica WOR_2 bacterium RIFCSPHIGHO2_02_FULL_50_17]|nr:MAG: hypothetical protein A3D87_01715 [Omnitrophica WOR_2 bacterium RIFCSPHIGHO2_02_FULL_50_17]